MITQLPFMIALSIWLFRVSKDLHEYTDTVSPLYSFFTKTSPLLMEYRFNQQVYIGKQLSSCSPPIPATKYFLTSWILLSLIVFVGYTKQRDSQPCSRNADIVALKPSTQSSSLLQDHAGLIVIIFVIALLSICSQLFNPRLLFSHISIGANHLDVFYILEHTGDVLQRLRIDENPCIVLKEAIYFGKQFIATEIKLAALSTCLSLMASRVFVIVLSQC